MQSKAIHTPLVQTGSFSTLVQHYVEGNPLVQPYFLHEPNADGLDAALRIRSLDLSVDRTLLVEVLKAQYQPLPEHPKVMANINLLAEKHCFTVTTAHQPNIFTGHLYFVYKILHTVSLCAWLAKKYPEKAFVPVFYMGSEDADLDELGQIHLMGEHLQWKTTQKGAVGRMTVDKPLLQLVEQVCGMIATTDSGHRLASLIRQVYRPGNTIQSATLELIHAWFGDYGVVVLNADHPELKKRLIPILEADLFAHEPARLVQQTIDSLGQHYKVQASPREINVFYLMDGMRERIERRGAGYAVVNTDLIFTAEDLRETLHQHPERFSPNVMLRGLYQEILLPNLAFVGGGGELAYWLELKGLFQYFGVPFPVLFLRNSFALVKERDCKLAEKLGFEWNDFFSATDELKNEWVKRTTSNQIHLTQELRDSEAFYTHLEQVAQAVDPTLQAHAQAIGKRALKALSEMEKKLVRAEKRKYREQLAHIERLRRQYFPGDGLQERYDNVLPYYAEWGDDLWEVLIQHSPPFHQGFISLMLA